MRFSETKNHPVMSTTEAITVGKLAGYVIDPGNSSIAGILLKKTEVDGNALPWASLKAFGRDAITVESSEVITVVDGRLAELSGKKLDIMGKRVLTDAGVELGNVVDVDFDAATGSITAVLTDTEEIAGSRLIGLGTYALVVAAA